MDDVETAKAKLNTYLSNNPASSVGELHGLGVCVTTPWGDGSIALKVSEAADTFYDALNNVFLPDQYSLIYHLDTREAEVIFTAFRMSLSVSGLEGRKFDFVFDGNIHPCSYEPSSSRLLEIAKQHQVLTQSPTQSRNLSTFKQAQQLDALSPMNGIFGTPMSFWIRNLDWKSPDFIQSLVKNLNFYMAYFDTSTPRVLIHSLNGGSAIQPENTRFPLGNFPTEIVGHRIDDNLYQFWDATLSGDPIRKFLYNYQILEYASVYYLDEDNKRAIRRLLKTPDASARLDTIVQSIIETLGSAKMHDIHKIEALVNKCVDYDLIWAELTKRITAFSTDMMFDGGFVSKHLLRPSVKQDDFKPNWVATLCGRLRDIRNALSHGKETRSGSVIFPTIENQDRLQIWLPVLSMAARQIILYNDTV